MAGKIYAQLQNLMQVNAQKDEVVASYIRTKLILKGINPDKYGPTSEDNPEVLAIIENLSKTLKRGYFE